jgi:L-methionine (R)-S-oxide reductase
VFQPTVSNGVAKPQLYSDVTASLGGLLEGETDPLANLANAAALLAGSLDGINWCGFYLLRGDELVLGPFQGKPACVRIALGKGVCGTAAAQRETVVVADVLTFPGHIACDGASRSEIVVPILVDGALAGVLDVDAPETDRFDDEDRAGLEAFVAALTPRIRWEEL